jgi:hypothetical protein
MSFSQKNRHTFRLTKHKIRRTSLSEGSARSSPVRAGTHNPWLGVQIPPGPPILTSQGACSASNGAYLTAATVAPLSTTYDHHQRSGCRAPAPYACLSPRRHHLRLSVRSSLPGNAALDEKTPEYPNAKPLGSCHGLLFRRNLHHGLQRRRNITPPPTPTVPQTPVGTFLAAACRQGRF